MDISTEKHQENKTKSRRRSTKSAVARVARDDIVTVARRNASRTRQLVRFLTPAAAAAKRRRDAVYYATTTKKKRVDFTTNCLLIKQNYL